MSLIEFDQISFDDKRWPELVKESQTATFFQTPEWLSLWVKHFISRKRHPEFISGSNLPGVEILGVFEEEELIGVAPLLVYRGKVTLLGVSPVLGSELVSDFGDIVVLSGREKEVWKAILKNFQLSTFNFQLVREESPSFKVLKDLGGKEEKIDVAPYIDLPESWDEYLADLERKQRHELRRKIRRLEEQGAFKVCHEGMDVDVDEFFRLVSLSSEEKRDFLSPEMRSFFEDIFIKLFPKKMVCLCFMKLDGKNIAASMLFIFKDELLLYNSGFDPKYAYLSPGLLLKAFIIKHAIFEKKKRFDFLRGGERYKYDLGGRKRKLYKISF